MGLLGCKFSFVISQNRAVNGNEKIIAKWALELEISKKYTFSLAFSVIYVYLPHIFQNWVILKISPSPCLINGKKMLLVLDFIKSKNINIYKKILNKLRYYIKHLVNLPFIFNVNWQPQKSLKRIPSNYTSTSVQFSPPSAF